MKLHPQITARQYGILAGLDGKESWDNPYSSDSYAAHVYGPTREAREWEAGRQIGERLTAPLKEEA